MGTRLVTSYDVPALVGAYKLTESAGRPVMKTSTDKLTLPGAHQVFRVDGHDTVGLADEPVAGLPLLQPVLRAGRLVEPLPALDEIRARAAAELAALPPAVRAIDRPDTLPPRLSPRLQQLREALAR